MTQLTKLSKNVKGRLAILTSVTMAATLFTGTGLTVFAAPDTKKHTISYDMDGGTPQLDPVTTDVSSGDAGTQLFTTASLDGVTKVGYTAKGFTATEANKIKKMDGTSIAEDGDVDKATQYIAVDNTSLKVKWDINTYSITYNKNGADGTEEINSTDYHVNDASAPAFENNTFTYTGHTFVGWSTSSNVTKDKFKPGNGRDFVEGATLDDYKTNPKNYPAYAIWQANQSTIGFNKNDGGATGTAADLDYTYGTALTIPKSYFEAFTKEGYEVEGFAESATGAVVYTPENNVIPADKYPDKDGQKTLYAKYKADDNILVSFDGNGATSGEMTPQKFTAGTPQNLTKNSFEKEGYSFNKWAVSATVEGTIENEASYTTTKAATLFATWTVNKYTVAFNDNGGTTATTPALSNVAYDEKITIPESAATAPTGYEFAGWATNKNAKEPELLAGAEVSKLSAVNNDTVTYYAVWTAQSSNTITVTYDLNGGTGTAPESPVRGVDLPYDVAGVGRIVAPTNYTFVGWATTADATEPEFVQGTKKITNTDKSDIDLFAVYQATVDFDPNDGEGSMDDQIFTFGVPQAIAANEFEREGYEFGGWAVKPTATTADYKNAEEIDNVKGTTFYAVWVEGDVAEAVKATEAANKAAAEAKTAAEEANAAAKNVEDDPTPANVKAANDAAAVANTKAEEADAAAAKAKAAAGKVSGTVKTDAEAAAAEATNQATAARTAKEAAEKAAKDGQAKIDAKTKAEAIADAEAAADKAVKDPTDANIQAAKDAVKLAESKGATADDLKLANDKIAQAEAAKEAADKAADDSAKGTPAPVGTELVDANGNKTGFKVTDANASAPEVEYEAPADKNATKADIPETYTDLSGNVYKVVGIDARAFKDTKVKTVTIRKNIKRIDPKAFEKSKVKNVKIKGTKLTKKMAKSFKKLKKGGKIKCSGSHKKKNKEILNNLSTVKNGKTKVK
ncbi:InlB B-repeat-containing protein [Butyrivibrio sp. XPD2002]|uniref:InlB B-repeat-containing protein n=1 Tax=Butyrivibrio sp. XPD2002 TaxID=1280665 RepID=UPI0003F80AFF|nr:InlB B-repeat-containing protein [Butyrivibrio sp. XPD2002]